MEEYDQDNYHSQKQKQTYPRLRGTSQHPPSSFGDDFGDGFSGGKAKRGKVKVKAKSMVHAGVPYIEASHPPPVTARSRPRYWRDTALIISGPEDSGSADELNLCGPQSETQSRSRRAGTRTYRPLSNTFKQNQSTARNERGMPQSLARGAWAGAVEKETEYRVAKVVPLPSQKEGRPFQELPLNAPILKVTDRTVSSSRMSTRRSRSIQRASRAATHTVAPTSPSKVPLHHRPSLSDLHSLATSGDLFSSTELVQPDKSSKTRKEESELALPNRFESLNKEYDLGMNRLPSEKRNKKPLLASQKGKASSFSSTSSNFSSSTRGSRSSKASTRSGRKRFESDGESSSYQREEVPWADLMNFPSSLDRTTPKSRSTGTSKSSQSSSMFPMHLTPPNLRMKKQANLNKRDELIPSTSGNGSGRSPKRKRSSTTQISDFSDECVIVPWSEYCF